MELSLYNATTCRNKIKPMRKLRALAAFVEKSREIHMENIKRNTNLKSQEEEDE